MSAVVLSSLHVRPLLEARKTGKQTASISLDLGMTSSIVELTPDGIILPGGEHLDWSSVEKMSKSDINCYRLTEQGIERIQVFSEYTNRPCSLIPTHGAPSMLIAGFVMHRIKDIDPWQHAQRMIETIAPMVGHVLDTTTGLGYTSILSSRSAESVTTIEIDPGAQSMARLNPWSQELFDNPKITQVMGDACEVVPDLATESFDRVIHDPPTFSLAGDLYSGVFYRELYRVLKRGGRLFHYVGDPESKASGGITRGVLRRLQEAGFSRVVRRSEAYGVVAYK